MDLLHGAIVLFPFLIGKVLTEEYLGVKYITEGREDRYKVSIPYR